MTRPKSRLQVARESLGLSRLELAYGSRVNVHTVEAVELGRRTPSPEMAELIELTLLRAAVARIDNLEHACAAAAVLELAAAAEPVEAPS